MEHCNSLNNSELYENSINSNNDLNNNFNELCDNLSSFSISTNVKKSTNNRPNLEKLIIEKSPIKCSMFETGLSTISEHSISSTNNFTNNLSCKTNSNCSKFSKVYDSKFNNSKYQHNVYKAIKSLNDKNGSSLAAIKKWLLKNIEKWDNSNNQKVTRLAINPMVSNGLLMRNIGKFKLTSKARRTKWESRKSKNL